MSRRLAVALIVLVAVLIGIVIATIIRQNSRTPPPPPVSPTATTAPRQATLLVQVRDEDLEAVDDLMLGLDEKTGQASALSLQPGLAVDVDNAGQVTLAETGTLAPGYPTTRSSAQLGIRVDGAFVLDRLALAGLVDAVGGVVIEVPVTVVRQRPDGTTQVIATAGRRRLFGPAAASYVTTLMPGEAQSARMQRFTTVWDAVMRQLPPDLDHVRAIIGSLGSLAKTQLSVPVVSQFLHGYRAALLAGQVRAETLQAAVTGVGATAIYDLLPAAAVAATARLFADSVIAAGVDDAAPRVRIVDSGSALSSVVEAKQRISGAGYTFVWGGDGATISRSVVAVPDQAARAELGTTLAQILGFSLTQIAIDPGACIGTDAQIQLAPGLLPSPSPTGSATSPASAGSSPSR